MKKLAILFLLVPLFLHAAEGGVSIPLGAKGRFVYEPRASFHYLYGDGTHSWDVRVFPASFSFRIL